MSLAALNSRDKVIHKGEKTKERDTQDTQREDKKEAKYFYN